MRNIRSSLTSLLITAAAALPLAACGHHGAGGRGYMHFDQGSISLKNGAVVIKLKNHDSARVDGDGRMSIGGEELKLTPQGQAALAHYNAGAVQFTDQAVSLGLESVDFALHTVGQVFEGLLHGSAEQAGKEAERGGQAIEARARALCQRMEEWRQAQDAAAQAVPQFKPYAVITPHDTRDCYVESDDGKPKDEGKPKEASPAQISS